MEIVTTPQALPGCCFICGSATRKYYIDTGRSLDFHGAVYFCSECLTEIAHLAGFLSPEASNKLKIEFSKLETQVYELTKRETGLENAIRGMAAAGYRNGDVPNGNGNPDLSIEKSESESQGTENSLGVGEGETVKQGNDENMGKLRSNDEPASTFDLSLD